MRSLHIESESTVSHTQRSSRGEGMGDGVPRREATETVPDSLKATSDCSRTEGMSRGRRDSPSFPGLLQAQPGVHSHECSSSLAKNSRIATNTNIHLHIYAICCSIFLFSSSRSANWLHSVLLDTEQLDKFRTLTVTSQPCLKSQTWGITGNINQPSRA